jgi:hypothetical protein
MSSPDLARPAPGSGLTSHAVRADTVGMDRGMPQPPAGHRGGLEDWERVAAQPPAAPGRRPVAVTVSGVLLIVAGAFAGVAAVLILATGEGATIEGVGAEATPAVVVVAIALAMLQVAAGMLVLRCTIAGRVVGIVMSALGIAGGLLSIASPRGLVTIAIFGFVAYVLLTNREAFGRAVEG